MPLFQALMIFLRALRRHARPLSGGCLLLACGGAEPREDQALLEQSVIQGQPSPATQNAIVAIYYPDTWATGTMVAPNLVLTSKQILFDRAIVSSSVTMECSLDSKGSPIGQVRDPEDFLVMFGEKFPMTATARGLRIYANAELDLCRSDVALLEIDAEFPIDPVPLRLNTPPVDDEVGNLVGWGLTDERLKSPPGAWPSLMGKRNQLELAIEKVGPADYPLPGGGLVAVTEDTFVTKEGGCYGDAGAPFLARESGAIVGTLTSFEPDDLAAEPVLDVQDCYGSHATFRSLSPEREWLLDAFRSAGAVPWLEGLGQPAANGEACGVDEECLSGHCLATASEGFCSVPCDESPCGSEQQCLEMDGERWCVPERVGSVAPETSSCSLSMGHEAHRCPVLFSLLALTLVRRRVRRRFDESRQGRSKEAHR
jgi:hypothetical protein